jgi:hypothetical protein
MKNNPIVAEVQKTREKLAAWFGFDLDTMFKELRKQQFRAARGMTLHKPRHFRSA